MSCINRNVFYLREGTCRKLPLEVGSMSALHDVLLNVWLAKVSPCKPPSSWRAVLIGLVRQWMVENTISVVERYVEKRKLREEEEREELRALAGYT